jgi:hypothetical protein
MVGILTFHRALNYGALLQAYALHRVLNDQGISNCIIDYKCDHFEKEYHLFADYKYVNIKGKVVRTLNIPDIIAKRIKFKTFIKNHIKLSEKKDLTRTDLVDNWKITGCDTIITGSDQIWNNNVTNFDKTYFLDFVNDPQSKKSYAASFGFNKIPEELISEYRALLSDFSHISVREKIGADIIKQLCGRMVPINLDPTLLLKREMWMQLCSDTVKIKNYILVFCIIETESIRGFANKLSNKTGCPVITVMDKVINSLNVFNNLGLGPCEFLDLFKHARYIVTNSYHGTAFSINFNKDFFVELQTHSNNTNSRILQLLELFGLQNREIHKGTNTINLETVEFGTINSILFEQRKMAITWLKEITTKTPNDFTGSK